MLEAVIHKRGKHLARVTIKSIAKDLGISHMTVSRALSDNPNVLKKTREAVQKRAQELGYVRNAAAVAMRGDGKKIVGLVLPNLVNEFYARFANAMALACEEHAIQLIIHVTNDRLATEAQAMERLREVQASTVIVVPTPGQGAQAESWPAGPTVIELIRTRHCKDSGPAILVDDSDAIENAVQHLAEQGHSRIAYIGGDAMLSSGAQRLAAYQKGIASAGLTPDEALLYLGKPSFEMGRDNAKRMIAAGQATALLCGGFEISNGALSAFVEAQAQGAGSMAFIGYGDPSFYTWVSGGVSTIQVPLDDLTQCAIELICEAEDLSMQPPLSFAAKLMVRRS